MSSPENLQTLAVLPIKNAVLFPSMLMPLTVGRPSSIAAIEAALASEGKEIVSLPAAPGGFGGAARRFAFLVHLGG